MPHVLGANKHYFIHLVFARTTLLLFSSGESFRAKERVSLARLLKTEVRDSFQQLISIESNKTFIFPLSHSMQCALLVVAAPLFFSLPLSPVCEFETWLPRSALCVFC
jgi:ABC-type sulfate transport system permease component